ncbi:hypothetical protein EKO23_16330 [Nocardioides guangzhouensis]|uniref:Uncharacterized protein n=1 Tax=Nocardioides guangzhouensis TaxID=2497878 RepID=A0A4Q4Z8L3_9ACTN|nr:hypothetical protein [Nocardioides guangzhouensis]RYP84227.1 hypothetical protein EKO23_16330 [Nocardioides guangzhouensis]
MPTDTHPAAAPRLGADRAELEEFLLAYRPTGVPDEAWTSVHGEATRLVLDAGELTRLRVEKDIQVLGAVAAHLLDRGRLLTLDELLSETTLLSYDATLTASRKTRENKRGILRRLQSVHHGVPWRQARRSDGERVASLISHNLVPHLHRVELAARDLLSLPAARRGDVDQTGATDFLEALDRARAARVAGRKTTSPEASTWRRARAFAREHGMDMTVPVLRALVTHELLTAETPVATAIGRHGLTRRDLDLALTSAAELPKLPGEDVRALLRGI